MPSSASNIRSAWFTTVRVSWRRSRAAQHADLSAHAGGGAQLSPLADRPTAAWGARRRAASRRHPNLHRQYAAPRALPRACVAAPAAPGLPKSCLSWKPCCHLNRHRTSQTAVARYAHVTRVDAARYARARYPRVHETRHVTRVLRACVALDVRPCVSAQQSYSAPTPPRRHRRRRCVSWRPYALYPRSCARAIAHSNPPSHATHHTRGISG